MQYCVVYPSSNGEFISCLLYIRQSLQKLKALKLKILHASNASACCSEILVRNKFMSLVVNYKFHTKQTPGEKF